MSRKDDGLLVNVCMQETDATTGLQEQDAAIRMGPGKLSINVDGRDRCPNSANVSGMSGDAQQNSCFYANSGWMALLP